MNILKLCTIIGIAVCLASASSLKGADCGPGGCLCPSGTCHFPTYIQGCLIYSSSTSCHECQYNYIKSGNICTYSPPGDNSDCCKAFVFPSGECSQCAKGLSIIDGKCVDRKIVGCLEKSRTGTCVNCALQYSLFGGLCVKKIAGCSKYKSTGVCQSCLDKFQFINGNCIPRIVLDESCRFPWTNSTGQCLIPGCQSVSDFGCGRCQAGFRLLPDGTCKKGTIEGCQRYAPDGFCQSCKRPFYTQSSSGFCMTSGCNKIDDRGRCISCDSAKGFQMGNDGYCIITNCLVSSGQQCIICERGYIQIFGKCRRQTSSSQKLCTVCARNFYQTQNGECKPRQAGCLNYNRFKCSQCEPRLYLSRNFECLPREPGCIYNEGVCQDCKQPFKRSKEYRCVIQGCRQYSQSGCRNCVQPYIIGQGGFCTYQNCLQVEGGRCLKCIDGFGISNQGFCYILDPFCKAYSYEGRCIDCKIGYYGYRQNGVLKCKQQKLGCNYVDGRCVSCRAPFEYNSKQQSCSIDGCLQYFLGGCSQCAGGYDLRYNTCKLPFCLVSRKGNCIECDPNYIMKSDGTCVNKDEFCWKYDNNGNCLQCAPEYFLSKLTNKCKLRQPGCQYNEKDRCFACQKPFYFDGVRCQIYGCMKLNYKGCEECFYPREITKTGLCSVINCDRMEKDKCVACKPGFMNANDGSCQVEDPKCLKYCQKGCQKCVKGYRVDKYGKCQYADEHCWDFSDKGHCTNCDRLYFLNVHNKCELKDSNCAAYSKGRCVQCKNYFYIHRGLCYPNAKGCIKQNNIKKCQKCQSGYKLEFGVCTPEITRLSWDSINMDFWSGQSDESVSTSKQVFTIGKTNKLNLDGAISKGKGKIIYSSVAQGRKSFQVDDFSDENGWSPSGSGKQPWIGVLLQRMQTFYAVDIKFISGNSLSRFAIEQSDNGISYRRVQQFTLSKSIIGSVETYYFTPVQSRSIRLVVLKGVPNIKVQFYYSNGENNYKSSSSQQSYIVSQTQEVILDSIRGQIFDTKEGCVDKDLCWMGIQLCEPKPISGFSFVPNKDSKGTIQTVSIKYSLDGVKFACYNDCKDLSLNKGSYKLNPLVTALKLRVYPSKWVGEPSFSVNFQY